MSFIELAIAVVGGLGMVYLVAFIAATAYFHAKRDHHKRFLSALKDERD